MCVLWTHGDVIGWLVLAAWTAALFGGFALVGRRFLRRAQRDADARFLAAVSPVGVDATLLRGRVHRDQDRWSLVVGDRSVVLTGAVLAGDARDGDEVIAEGTVTYAGGVWAMEPRIRRGPAWWKGPVGPGAPVTRAPGIVLHSIPASRAVPRLGWGSALVALGAACVVGYASVRVVGKVALDHMADEPVSLGKVSWGAIAAAVPGTRADALETATWRLERRFGYRAEIADDRIALADFRGDCRVRIATEMERADYDAALADLDRCDPVGAVTLRLELGLYGDIAPASVTDWPYAAGLRALALGDWRAAAEAADRIAELLAADKPGDEAWTAAAKCKADLFRAYAGDEDARKRLDARGAGSAADPACELMAGLIAAPPERLAAFDAVIARARFEHPGKLARALLDIEEDRGERAARDYDSPDFVNLPDGLDWLGRWGRPDEARGERRARLLVSRAAFAWNRGQLDVARHELTSPAVPYDEACGHEARYVARHLAFTLGDLAPPHSPESATQADLYESEGWGLRAGKLDTGSVYAFPAECRSSLIAGLQAAQRGDGAPLADIFGRCNVFWTTESGWMEAVLPLVTTHRERLATALRTWGDEPSDILYQPEVFRFLKQARRHRDLANLAGDAPWAARWQTILDRQAAVFADRDRLVAMILWTSVL